MKAKYAQQYNAILKPNDVRNGNIISNVIVIIVIVVKVAALPFAIQKFCNVLQ